MSGTYTIGELAAAAGVAASTVRFYEREGLLVPDGRTEARYRVYGGGSLKRLRFIRSAQEAGLALTDIRAVLGLQASGAAACGDVRHLIEQRLQTTEQRLADLRRVQKLLRAALAECRDRRDVDECAVVEKLAAGEAAAPTARRSRVRRTNSGKSLQP